MNGLHENFSFISYKNDEINFIYNYFECCNLLRFVRYFLLKNIVLFSIYVYEHPCFILYLNKSRHINNQNL